MSEKRKASKGVINPDRIDEGTPVAITDTKELWSEWKLEDGAKVRVRPTVLEVRKLKKVDAEGNSVYLIKNTMIIDIQHAPKKIGGR